jgi:sec-independent protein translocase protein TatA
MPTPGPLELVIILVIALLILGPGKLPDVGAALGKSIREFRKASSDISDATRIDTSPLPPNQLSNQANPNTSAAHTAPAGQPPAEQPPTQTQPPASASTTEQTTESKS